MYRGLKRAAIWADRPARARRGVPHRHRRLVRRRRRPRRRRRGPRGPGRASGTAPTTSRSVTSSAAASSGWRRSTALCIAGGLDLAHALRRDRRVRPGPVPRPRAPARHPRPATCRRAWSTWSAWPGPATCSSPPPRSTPPRAARWAWSARSCPTTSSTRAREWILEQIRSTGPIARATIKRDLNAQLRPGDVSLFMVPGLSAEIAEGMGAVRREASRQHGHDPDPDHHAHHAAPSVRSSTGSTCATRSTTRPRVCCATRCTSTRCCSSTTRT